MLHRGGDLGDVSHLAREVAGHGVDVVGQVLPHATDAFDLGLAAQLALGADLVGDTRHLVGECVQLVDHRVHSVLQLEQLALDVDSDLLGEVALLHGGGDLGDVSHLTGQVAGHRVDVVGQLLPGAADSLDLGLTAQLALRAHLARHARHLVGEQAQLVDQRVDGLGRVEELALQAPAVDLERHRLRQVAGGDRADDAAHLHVRPREVFDEVVDGVERAGPCAARVA